MKKAQLDQLLPLTPVTLQILLSLCDGPKHGYGIKHEVEERTGGRVRLGAGTLYGALRRLDTLALVEEVDSPAQTEGETERWRFYGVTAAGKQLLLAELESLQSDVRTARSKGPPIGLGEAT